MSIRLKLPKEVQGRARSLGTEGEVWLDELDSRLAHLVGEWQLSTTNILSGGSESLVIEATTAQQQAAILKIGLPGCDTRTEAHIYQLAGGRGYPELIAEDTTHNAILLERLGAPLEALSLPLESQYEIICATLTLAWLAPVSPKDFMSGADKARYLSNFTTNLWQTLNKPCRRATLDRALEFASLRTAAHQDNQCVLVHGDCHAQNTLQATNHPNETRYKFVDPDGLWAEPAYDMGILLRDDNAPLLGKDSIDRGLQRCALLARLSGCDEQAIWHWGFLERVSTGLHLIEIGLEDWGRQSLSIADRWAEVRS